MGGKCGDFPYLDCTCEFIFLSDETADEAYVLPDTRILASNCLPCRLILCCFETEDGGQTKKPCNASISISPSSLDGMEGQRSSPFTLTNLAFSRL